MNGKRARELRNLSREESTTSETPTAPTAFANPFRRHQTREERRANTRATLRNRKKQVRWDSAAARQGIQPNEFNAQSQSN